MVTEAQHEGFARWGASHKFTMFIHISLTVKLNLNLFVREFHK